MQFEAKRPKNQIDRNKKLVVPKVGYNNSPLLLSGPLLNFKAGSPKLV